MMRVGIVGMGFMGGVHFHAWSTLDAARIVAVCDEKQVSTKATQGNIETGAGELDLAGVAVHTRLADMLAVEHLDAVSIALPTHLHKTTSIQCLAAGVHVLCEKPMALHPADCAAMVHAADAAGKELMIAQCIRFWPAYAWLKETVANATLGKPLVAEFERLTHAPAWSDDAWYADETKSGGIALDLHIHDVDFVRYCFGEPHAISAKRIPLSSGTTGHIQTAFDYPNGPRVTATASWLMPASFGFRMAFKVLFSNGAAEFDGQKLSVYPTAGAPFSPALPAGDGYAREIEHFAMRVTDPQTLPTIPPADAAESVRLSLETLK